MLGLFKKIFHRQRAESGLAFGPDRVAIAVMRRDGRQPVLERCELYYRWIRPPAPRPSRAAIQAAGLPRMPVSTVLRPEEYQLALVEAPEVPPAELRAAMRWRLKDTIDFGSRRRSSTSSTSPTRTGAAMAA